MRCKERPLAAPLLLALLLGAALWAGAEGASPAKPSPAPSADRWREVFDGSGDAGRLTARFLRLFLPGPSDSSDKAGDATILSSPDGKVLLVDAGATECGPR